MQIRVMAILLFGVVGVVGGVLLLLDEQWLWGAVASGVGVIVLLMMMNLVSNSRRKPTCDPERMEDLNPEHRKHLIRGTSMHLRDMKYRYSVRYDHTDRPPFTTVVNTITLGFLPVIILDNESDKQGYGYIAFPHDGERWRGPGLPCAGSPDDAVAHASLCVSPLGNEDDDDE